MGRTRGPKKHKRPAPTPQPGAQSSFAPPQRPSRGAKWLRPAPTPQPGAQNGFAPPQRPGWGENWLRTAPERTTTLMLSNFTLLSKMQSIPAFLWVILSIFLVTYDWVEHSEHFHPLVFPYHLSSCIVPDFKYLY